MNSRRVFIGWDSREVDAYNVCVESLRRTSADIEIHPIKKDEIAAFNREEKNVSTEFAYSRFLTPYLSGYEGWSLFVDCDFLFTRDVNELFDLADDEYAVEEACEEVAAAEADDDEVEVVAVAPKDYEHTYIHR